jgi:F-type H+-transporting ATPase subunit b
MRRTRLLLAAAALALAVGGPLAGGASAQEEPGDEGISTGEPEGQGEPEGTTDDGNATAETRELGEELEHAMEEAGAAHSDAECALLLGEGGTVEDCQASPNPLLPETNEIIWGSIGFIIVFGFLAKVGYPAMRKTMEGRTERIRTDLEGAESAKVDAQRVLDEYRAQLGDAKAEAGRIIEESRQQADALKRDQEQRLQAELSAMRERAAADVESARAQALADLRGEVAALVSEGVDRVVRGGIDPVTQRRLVDEYIASLAARSN